MEQKMEQMEKRMGAMESEIERQRRENDKLRQEMDREGKIMNCWDPANIDDGLAISNCGLTITKIRAGHNINTMAFAKFPLSNFVNKVAGRYYEVKVAKGSRGIEIGVQIGGRFYRLRSDGWIHAGEHLCGDNKIVNMFGEGDTIGVGLANNHNQLLLFFTKNSRQIGNELGRKYSIEKGAGNAGAYPAVCIEESATVLIANFGADPFAFNPTQSTSPPPYAI